MMLKCRKRRLRETKFEKFYGGHAPRPPGLEACAFSTCISSLEANKNPPFFPQKGLECLDSEHPPLLLFSSLLRFSGSECRHWMALTAGRFRHC